jgi:putative ABC transport system permease protein
MTSFDIRFALRSLQRSRSYTAINSLGLGLGLATFLLVALYAYDEWRFDRHFEKADRLVRFVGNYSTPEETQSFARVPPAVAPIATRTLPAIEAAGRLQKFSVAVRSGDRVFQAKDFFFADPEILTMFGFPFTAGNPEGVLEEPFTMVLTQEMARRYFGTEDVVGRRLVVADTLEMTVTGVLRDLPTYSHLQFGSLASFATYRRVRSDVELDDLWTWGTFYSYALLREGSDWKTVEAELARVIDDRLGDNQNDGSRFDATLQPVTDVRLKSNLRQELGPNGSARQLALFGLIGLLVLIIACINFVNLATARASRRAREVGVRKSVGASQGILVRQFLTESVTLSVVALAIAYWLMMLFLPGVNDLAGKAFTAADLTRPGFLALAFVTAAVSGLLAGAYPSAVLTAYRPAAVLTSQRSSGLAGRAGLRQLLVVVQFSASIFLIGSTIIASRQADHIRHAELGLAHDEIVVLPFYWDEVVHERYGALKAEIKALPAVKAVTASGDVPGRMFTAMSIWAEGMPDDASKGVNALIVDPDFAETYDLRLAAGRDFDTDRLADMEDAFMLNESAAALVGWTAAEAVGKELYMNDSGTVVGVFEDFHYEGVQAAVEPIVMAFWPSWFGYVSVRFQTERAAEVVAGVERIWSNVLPERPFEYFFLDEDFDQQYAAEVRFGRMFLVLAILALLIASLGLYGLATFVVETRVKEIGIRKVLGAESSTLALLLSRRFMLLIGIAFVIATPVTWWVMSGWLEGSTVRIAPSAWHFVAAGVVALIVALIPVAAHALRAIRSNPVESLRYE